MEKIQHQKITTRNVAKKIQIFFSQFGQFFFRKNNIKKYIPFFTFTFFYFGEFRKINIGPFIDLV